jgi:hypothetical protein
MINQTLLLVVLKINPTMWFVVVKRCWLYCSLFTVDTKSIVGCIDDQSNIVGCG